MKAAHKYGAVRTERDGFHFDSAAEARYFDWLKAEQAAGAIVGFTRQVPLHFPGNVRFVVDFQVFYADGRHELVEIKGMETQAYRVKLKLFEQFYGWMTLRVLRPSDF